MSVKNWSLLFLLLSWLGTSHAQNPSDALRYSRSGLHGTARYVGVGGAFGALGADMSTLGSNPAGIGFFRKNEITFSPGFSNIMSDADFRERTFDGSEFTLNVNDIGFAGSFPASKDQVPLKSLHLGISYSRQANFNQSIKIKGNSPNTTMLDEFKNLAEGYHPDQLPSYYPFSANMAYQAYLIDPANLDSTKYSHRLEDSEVEQEKNIFRSGNMGETRFTFGADFSNRIYLGITVGIPSINFEQESSYEETVQDTSVMLSGYEYTESLKTSGTGYNFKVGLILRPMDRLRIGLAAHSPSYFSMSDNWSTSMNSTFDDTLRSLSTKLDPVTGSFDYRLQTPYHILGSIAYLFGKRGLITAEYEFTDYGAARLKPQKDESEFSFARENIIIKEQFVETHTFKFGTEWRFPPFLIRGGFRISDNPYRKEFITDHSSMKTYSGGLGYRIEKYFVDVAYSRTYWPEDHYMYDPSLVEVASIDHTMARLIITGGIRF